MSRFKVYYTEDETTKNLFTSGAEWMTVDKTEYIGAYHRYTTGEVYTKAAWNPQTSVKLIPYIAPDSLIKKNETYINLQPNIALRKKLPIETPIIITINDIRNKFIFRYFLKKINDSKIIEVNQSQFSDWQSNNIDRVIYSGVDTIWFISGDIEDKIDGTVKIPGVISRNQQNLDIASKTIPELKMHLSDLLQYYTDSDFIIPVDINGLDS